MTKEEIIDNLKYQNKKFFGGQSQALTEAIKLIEELSANDCVSRQAVLDMAKSYNTDGWDSYTPLVVDVEDIEALPLVTPIYGTCKDCKYRDPEDKKCDCGHDIQWQLPREDNWYCADFEKRGSEND